MKDPVKRMRYNDENGIYLWSRYLTEDSSRINKEFTKFSSEKTMQLGNGQRMWKDISLKKIAKSTWEDVHHHYKRNPNYDNSEILLHTSNS